jgi:hypothetical protein
VRTSAVWKYRLRGGTQRVDMPMGAKPLTVAEQDGRLTIWWLVDPEEVRVWPWVINVAITGVPIPDDPGKLVGAIICTTPPNEGVVLHVFARAGT